MSFEDVVDTVDRTLGDFHLMANMTEYLTACGLKWRWVAIDDELQQRQATDGVPVSTGVTVSLGSVACPVCERAWES